MSGWMIGPSVDDRCRPRRPGIPRHPERITASKNSGRWLLNPPPLVPLSYAFVPFVPFVPAPLNRSEPLDYALFLPPCSLSFPPLPLSFPLLPHPSPQDRFDPFLFDCAELLDTASSLDFPTAHIMMKHSVRVVSLSLCLCISSYTEANRGMNRKRTSWNDKERKEERNSFLFFFSFLFLKNKQNGDREKERTKAKKWKKSKTKRS